MSWTISAPSARTPSRRVRRRAIGFSARASQMSCEERQQIGGRRRRGAPGVSSSSRAFPAGSFSCQSPLPFSSAMAKRHASAREPVVERVVVGRDEEPRLDRLAAELGQREVLAGAKLHLSLARLADRHPPSLGRAW